MSGWSVCGRSVMGLSHKKTNKPCQDYFLHISTDKMTALAAADGHGGKKYVRSDRGSKFACEASLDCLAQYEAVFDEAEASTIKETSENRFITDVINAWREKIKKDIEQDPFTEEEKSVLGLEEGSDFTKSIKAYGTTLLIVAALSDKIICWQIGDGDILLYNSKHGVKQPIKRSDDILGNETTSLCGVNAFSDFSVSIHNTSETRPELILLSTDGYFNSFKSSEDFFKAPSDFYSLLSGEGVKAVDDNLEEWLNQTSEEGSGDDITVVMAFAKVD